jgi:hypothetical protein
MVFWGVDCVGAQLKFFAEIGCFPIANIVCAGHHAVVGFANAVVPAIFAAVEVGIAVWAHSAKPDLHILAILDIQV